MTTLPNMGLILPTANADNGTWDDKINAAFIPVDAHDHTAGKGVLVPTAGLNINADLPMGSFGLTSLGKISFSTIATPSSGTKALYVDSADSELYWRTNAGVNVKLTSGSTINAALIGGIGGDYASISALVDYDDASDTYRFRQETNAAVRQYAKVSMADLIIREYDPAGDASVPTTTVTIKSPDSLSGSYVLTLPTGLPGKTNPLYITSAGVIVAAGFVRTLTLGPAHAALNANASTATSEIQLGTGGLGNAWYAIPLEEGAVITGFSFRLNKASDATNTLSVELYKIVDGTPTSIATYTNATNAPGNITAAKSDPGDFTAVEIAAGEVWQIRISNNDATPSAIDRIYNGKITFYH